METATTKSRTPSRCREWERNRRNKFNDAITRLGEVVKEINRASNASKDGDNVQYPKIEIVEKAIICLTSCVHEKTQLKAEILALQVKIDSENKQKENKKDASTQVFLNKSKKRQSDKYMKVLMLQKSKRKALKEKPVLTTNVTVKSKEDNSKPSVKVSTQNIPTKLPTLLPKSNLNDKKNPENTYVVLPAAPYIFPQRPLLLPAVPPAFLLLDSNLQTLNKSSFPIVNRNNSDVTKTTMVNILPISAYSRPLSATKSKKNNSKTKLDNTKKIRKTKQTAKPKKQPVANTDSSKTKAADEKDAENKEKDINNKNTPENTQIENSLISNHTIVNKSTPKETIPNKNMNAVVNKESQNTTNPKIINEVTFTDKTKEAVVIETPKVINTPKCSEIVIVEKVIVQKPSDVGQSTEEKNKANKITNEKDSIDKDKENKLPNILDTSLCESTVDGGNARLELAEEFLAASPTAAFLMSFPLVSGNRADSPAEEPPSTISANTKESNHRRNEVTTQTVPYYEKTNPNDVKDKPVSKSHNTSITLNKQSSQKYVDNNIGSKQNENKTTNAAVTSNVPNENPFLNLPMSSLLPTSCTLSDSTFGLDFDCNISKSLPTQSTSYASNSNFFYKSDPFSTVKSTIYSTSSISSGHEFNSFGLYPCAMEKYTSKNKTDYSNVEDNLMKIGSSRLTYDIDLGWSHKGFDFVNCTSAPNTFNKDNILTTTSGPYSTSYNPFNPDFHVPLVTANSNKKDSTTKPSSTFSETITSFYSQPTNLWSEDVPLYSNNNTSKTLPSRHQHYLHVDQTQSNLKLNTAKQFEPKPIPDAGLNNVIKQSHTGVSQQVPDKYTKKSPSKMHINWMTSEIRPMQTNCNPAHSELKEPHKPTNTNSASVYSQLDHNMSKKQDHTENNYFPISMHNFPPQTLQEELQQVWPSTRAAGTTEISIDPPPINLPTLVGDLALGPHDKKRTTEMSNRNGPPTDIQNCSNFFSVTQLMNRSSDNNMPSRYQGPHIESQKAISVKQNTSHSTNDTNRKVMPRAENQIPQPCYVFNDSKPINSFENMNQFSHSKLKTNKTDKSSKVQKNNYSAEALIRGGPCNQKLQDNNSTKFMLPSQKYNDFNAAQDTSVAQVSHFPPILDYSDNSYTGQHFSGTNLYNSTTNTISNSFYTNFIPGSSNLMSGNYSSGAFTGDFIDYNQSTECNYANHKYSELKMRNNPTMFQQEKVPSNYKSSRRESAAKHKLECSKKDSKKCQSKRAKLNNETEDWNDASHLLWQNKTPTKRHTNLMSEELPFPNYVGNQMTGQYQPDFFNSHIMTSNMQTVGHNVDRSLTSFPVTSRANFNLSTIFPEITMKVQ
ncbi:putative mediator of RNA polymerase II transcription subunit 26 [Pectinophora gossypiella]|nr:putative mediator of RNA polymerase II transcription subunit 26 [Pectinophora gossypiella]